MFLLGEVFWLAVLCCSSYQAFKRPASTARMCAIRIVICCEARCYLTLAYIIIYNLPLRARYFLSQNRNRLLFQDFLAITKSTCTSWSGSSTGEEHDAVPSEERATPMCSKGEDGKEAKQQNIHLNTKTSLHQTPFLPNNLLHLLKF